MTNENYPSALQRAIASNIRGERARARLSQQAVADGMQQLGFTWWHQQTTGAAERSERRVTADELIALATVLGTSPETLWRVPRSGP